MHGDEKTIQLQKDINVDILLMTNYDHVLTKKPERWEKEQEICKNMTTDSFLVIPGSEFSQG